MSNTENKPSTETENQKIEPIETVELDNVTGGCSRCGCGRPDANPTGFGALATTFQR